MAELTSIEMGEVRSFLMRQPVPLLMREPVPCTSPNAAAHACSVYQLAPPVYVPPS